MARLKERKKIIHAASTFEYLLCLNEMSEWSYLLLEENNGKKYNEFLKLLFNNGFWVNEEKITIKRIAEKSENTTVNVTKWIKEIYLSILDLNEYKPELFYKKDEIPVNLCISNYDNYFSFNIGLRSIPRMYESFHFDFIQAKIGAVMFYVSDITYDISENSKTIRIDLKAGLYCLYREFAISKAVYEGKINFRQQYELYDFEIDDIILSRERFNGNKTI